MPRCAVPTCGNFPLKTKSRGVSYHSFPKNPKLAKTWVIKCKRKGNLNIQHGRVCSDHFLPSDYEDDMKHRLLGLKERKILKADAVPSVKLSSCDHGNERTTSSRAERIRKRNVLQRALGRLKNLSPKREDDAPTSECSSQIDQPHSSGTVAKEVEKKDHIPIEPAVEIKEEPADYTSNPSTSNNNANEEFILPHEENSWTASDSVVEPQFTLSVASLALPNGPEASDGEQLKKKRKTNPTKITTSTIFVPPTTIGPEVRSQSPVYNFGEFSTPGSSKNPGKDQFDVFGEYIAAKLRSLDRRSCSFAQKAIGDIIFEAEMGKYLKGELCQQQITQS